MRITDVRPLEELPQLVDRIRSDGGKLVAVSLYPPVKQLLVLVVCLLFLACSGGSSGPSEQLAVGTYAYTSTVPFLKSDGSLGQSSFAGTLTLNYVAADSIAGTFQVVGLQSPATLGFKNADAYVLYARTTAGTSTIGHRIRPDLGCTARYIPSTVEGTCTLAKQ